MTPAEAMSRLTGAERGARSYGDATYSGAVALADPGEIHAADDEVSAEALQREFLALAEGMQELDTDAQTIGDALDMVTAEAEVEEAARQVRYAEGQLADAQAQLDAARAMPAGDGRDDAVAGAQEAVEAAGAALARARDRLREALEVAADLAASMREGLQRRHGDLKDAHDDAPVRAAERDFYSPGGN